MRLPRNLSGEDLAKELKVLGYGKPAKPEAICA
jgi:hypothetical protein